MIYLAREIAGWLLVLLGILMFLVVYDFCSEYPGKPPRPFDAAIMAIVGIFVFRGGIHLLKVAVAGRICRQTQDRLYPAPPSGSGPRPAQRKPERPNRFPTLPPAR
jgi:hypothetical protein